MRWECWSADKLFFVLCLVNEGWHAVCDWTMVDKYKDFWERRKLDGELEPWLWLTVGDERRLVGWTGT